MSRTVKNIICILVLVTCYVLCFGLYHHANKNIEATVSSAEHIVVDGVEYEREGDTTKKFTNNYLALFLLKCAVCDIFLVYLFLTAFNKKTFKETFEYKKKYVVFLVSYCSFVIIDFAMTILFGYIWINLDNELSYSDYEFIKNEERLIYKGEYLVNEAYDEQRRSLSSDDDEEVTLLFEGDFDAILLAHSITKNGNGDEYSIGRNAGLAFRKGVNADLTNIIVQTSGVYSPAMFIEGSTVDMRRSTFNTINENSPIAYVYGTLKTLNVTFNAESSYVLRLVNDASISIRNSELYSNDLKELKNIYITGSNSKLSETNNENRKLTRAMFNLIEASIVSSGGDLVTVENNYFDVLLQRSKINDVNDNGFRNILVADNGVGTFTLDGQNLTGGIKLENESNVKLIISGGSSFIGKSIKDEKSTLNVELSADSTISLTGDLFVNSFTNESEDNSNVTTNGFSIYEKGNKIL